MAKLQRKGKREKEKKKSFEHRKEEKNSNRLSGGTRREQSKHPFEKKKGEGGRARKQGATIHYVRVDSKDG